jgi:hypothetical protein
LNNLDNGTTLAVAGMCELFGEMVLLQGIGGVVCTADVCRYFGKPSSSFLKMFVF